MKHQFYVYTPTIREYNSAVDHVQVLLSPFLLIEMFTAVVPITVFLSLGIRGSIEIFVSLIIDEAKMQK